jgi:hypothetical protein
LISLSPTEIAQKLARIAKHPLVTNRALESQAGSKAEKESGDQKEGLGVLTTPRRSKTAERRGEDTAPRPAIEEAGYKRILLLLRNHSGVNFSLYKFATIERRIRRRMVLNKQTRSIQMCSST